MQLIKILTISSVCWPLAAGLLTGLFVKSHRLAHRLCVLGMLLSFLSIIWLCIQFMSGSQQAIVVDLMQWSSLPNLNAKIGLCFDAFAIMMCLMVSAVALLIHIYSIGYMQDDIGYVRFFSLISLFSFAMLFLIATNNLIGLFLGWESISLFSYFLIGFYYYKNRAAEANFKAFLINRFGDCAFCLGLALLIYHCKSTAYADVYANINLLANTSLNIFNNPVQLTTLIGCLFFIGAMSKSAQIPLHIWLPDSMEGPTPVSALLHAATMVTAGVYLLARFGSMIEFSAGLKLVITVIGATGALFLGMMALCEADIKRIIAFSTLSQLGYMMVAIGLGAYHIAIFHLIMHAFFKACLFMAAGSVIVGLHHEQNIFKMGGLWSSMPITGLCFFLSALSLSGIPPFSGFYSKDLILSVAQASTPASFLGYYVYDAILLGCLVTPLYIFRVYWTVFCGPENHQHGEVCESPWTIRFPMTILAILSIGAGALTLPFFVGPDALNIVPALPDTSAITRLNQFINKIVTGGLLIHALREPALAFSIGGVVLSWIIYKRKPQWTTRHQTWLAIPEYILRNQYGFDWVYNNIIVTFFSGCARTCQKVGEQYLINRTIENRVSQNIVIGAEKFSRVQTSYLNRYFAIMSVALAGLIGISLFYSGIL